MVGFYQAELLPLGANNADNAFNSTSVVANADGSILERLEYLQSNGGLVAAILSGAAGLASFPSAAAPANDVSLAEVIRAIYNLVVPTTATGTTDVDVSASDYTAGAGVPLLTITPAAGAPIADLIVDLDLNKDTTGLLVVNTSETIQLVVESKIDGTNWRSLSKSWPAASSTTGLGVPDAADDLDAADDSVGIRLHLGPVGVSQAIRINLLLSAETGGDAEIPYAVHYRAMAAPTITDVAAG
jgi:hypothetical protein